jgi:tetratricopeptide (TPR) repeat protein
MHEAFYRQGITKANEKDYQGAIAAFNEALLLNPTYAEAYFQRGLARFNAKGDLRWAVVDFNAALRLDPQNASILFARSMVHVASDNIEQAIADAKQAILLKPDYAAAYNLLGTIRQRQGETEKAIAAYKRAGELYLEQQDLANCRHCLAAIQKLQPAPEAAVSPVSEAPTAPAAPPSSPLPDVSTDEFLEQAVEKARRGYFQNALEDIGWALQIDPQDARAYACRARVLSELNDWRSAIDDYQQAANLLERQGNSELAQQMYDAIKRIKTLQVRINSTPLRSVGTLPRTRSSMTSAGRPSRKVQNKLLRLIGDDRKIVTGLVERLKERHPGMPEDWYWEKAIYDLERDRL